MNTLAILLVLTITVTVKCQEQQYTSRYENINIDEILTNKRLLSSYVKCMLDTGRCTAEGRELKSHIAEALQSGCSKCTTNQRNGIRHVINYLIKNEPIYWKQLIDKYDPQRTYTNKYESELNQVSQ